MKGRIKFLSFFYIIHRPVFLFKTTVLQTGLCLRPKAKVNPVEPIDRTGPYPEDGDRVQSPKVF
jgi:hypothetical protein